LNERSADQATRSSEDMSRLEAVVRPVLVAHGVELFDLVLRRERAGWVLRVVIDVLDAPGQPPSVTVDQCADVSRDLSTALDVADLLDHAYVLEVSSPGVERPLRSLRDYDRFAGKLAKLWWTTAPSARTTVLQARLRGTQGDTVLLEADGGSPREVPFAEIKKAQLVFERPGHPKSKARNPKQRAKERR
jgi:ribosome maturation factor RimP